jgi:four helix bundle protein
MAGDQDLSSVLNMFEEPTENSSFIDFTSLECWKSAKSLRIQISDICKKLPDIENKRLADQMIRASRSVTNNIAEGSGRYHYKESIKFYFISRGSLHELKDHLLIAFEENYISQSDFDSCSMNIATTSKILNGYIKYVIGLAKKYNNHDYSK